VTTIQTQDGGRLSSPPARIVWEPVSPQSALLSDDNRQFALQQGGQSLRTKQWVSPSRDASKGSLRRRRDRIDLGKSTSAWDAFLRKEVIQPHLPIRLPCYDFVPLTGHTFGTSLLAVGPVTSGAADSGDVTGGVYKARERIHRRLADRRLLAIPTSCRRVAACNPN
jgi:hypothetical protein